MKQVKMIRDSYNCGYQLLENGSLIEVILETSLNFSPTRELRSVLKLLYSNGFRGASHSPVQRRAVRNHSVYATFRPDLSSRLFSKTEVCVSIIKKGTSSLLRVYPYGILGDVAASRLVGFFKAIYHKEI
ncbi:MAG: hypothetical protein AABX71_01315 [Nanoarchaeota archaeon]